MKECGGCRHTNDKRWHQHQAEWEPELDRIVADIDRCFGQNFAEMGCAGEVRLIKGDDFQKWAVQVPPPQDGRPSLPRKAYDGLDGVLSILVQDKIAPGSKVLVSCFSCKLRAGAEAVAYINFLV